MAIVGIPLNRVYRNIDLVLALTRIITEGQPHSEIEVAVCVAELKASFEQMAKDLDGIASVPDLALVALRFVMAGLPAVNEVRDWVN